MLGTARADEILTLWEVAGGLEVMDRTIYRLAAGRKIPAFKVGGIWRFSRADIDRLILRRSESGDSGAPSQDHFDEAGSEHRERA